MRKFTRYMCNGELCHPLTVFSKDMGEPIENEVYFCDVDDDTGELPDGWLAVEDKRRHRTFVFCPRCKEYRDNQGGLK